jgi:uncharacterized protein
MPHLSLDVGGQAVRTARASIESSLLKTPFSSPTSAAFSEPRGVFVTINSYPGGEDALRGCIGYPLPVKPLGEAIAEVAVMASTQDPRFEPVTPQELNSIVVEVSILTVPRPLESAPQQRPAKLAIGEDGLIISRGQHSGLLLPQVASEYSMDGVEFLSQACLKAGLPPDAWLDEETLVETFQAEVFGEKTPGGDVERLEAAKSA